MEKCEKIVEEFMKKSKSVYQKRMVRECRKAYQKNPTTLERWNLCMHYSVLCRIPFSPNPNPVWECCKDCPEKRSAEEIHDAYHSGEQGKLPFGSFFKNFPCGICDHLFRYDFLLNKHYF